MQPQGERSTPINMHPQVSDSIIPDLGPGWEVVDERGDAKIPRAFFGCLQTVEAQKTSTRMAFSQHQPNPVASPPNFETTPPRIDFEDLYCAQLRDGDPRLAQTQLPARRRQAERSPGPRSHDDPQPVVPSLFAQTLAECTPNGAEFILWDHSVLPTSIRKMGGRLSKRVVRWALRRIPFLYRYCSLYVRRERVARVQQLMLRFAEVLAFQDQAHPGIPRSIFHNDALVALVAVLDGLEEVGKTKKK